MLFIKIHTNDFISTFIIIIFKHFQKLFNILSNEIKTLKYFVSTIYANNNILWVSYMHFVFII